MRLFFIVRHTPTEGPIVVAGPIPSENAALWKKEQFVAALTERDIRAGTVYLVQEVNWAYEAEEQGAIRRSGAVPKEPEVFA